MSGCYPYQPSGFVPSGLAALIATNVSSSIPIPSIGSKYVLVVVNNGPVVAFVAVGNVGVVASTSSTPLLPGQSVAMQQGFSTTVAAVTVYGAAQLLVQSGTGTPNTGLSSCGVSGDMPWCPTLPDLTIGATGTTPGTAAVVPYLANTLINSGPGGGIIIGVPASSWNGIRPIFTNWSGGNVTVYLYSGDLYYGQSVAYGQTLVHTQSMSLSVSQIGAVLVQN